MQNTAAAYEEGLGNNTSEGDVLLLDSSLDSLPTLAVHRMNPEDALALVQDANYGFTDTLKSIAKNCRVNGNYIPVVKILAGAYLSEMETARGSLPTENQNDELEKIIEQMKHLCHFEDSASNKARETVTSISILMIGLYKELEPLMPGSLSQRLSLSYSSE